MRYVIFLRAINTGGRRITMEDLRAAYREAGCRSVATHLATGNVIVEATRRPDSSRMSEIVQERFGFASASFIRSEEEVRAIVDRNPWPDPERLVEVSLIGRIPERVDAIRLEEGVHPPEALVVSGTEVYFLREGKGIETVHKESITERVLGQRTTRRGLRTLQTLVEKHLQ